MVDAMNVRGHMSPDPLSTFDLAFRRPWLAEKTRKAVPIEDYSQPILVLQASVPRYLQPRFIDQLDIDGDGQVRNGSVPALIERLMGAYFGSSARGPDTHNYHDSNKFGE